MKLQVQQNTKYLEGWLWGLGDTLQVDICGHVKLSWRTSQMHQLVFVWCEDSSVEVGPGGAAVVDVFKHSAVAFSAVAND